MQPTPKQQEEAREPERIYVSKQWAKQDQLLDGGFWRFEGGDESVEYVPTSLLSAHNTQIREVLEGLRFRHGCWCELPPNITSPDHTCECDAARELWERVQS